MDMRYYSSKSSFGMPSQKILKAYEKELKKKTKRAIREEHDNLMAEKIRLESQSYNSDNELIGFFAGAIISYLIEGLQVATLTFAKACMLIGIIWGVYYIVKGLINDRKEDCRINNLINVKNRLAICQKVMSKKDMAF